jgi:hypothetical protein
MSESNIERDVIEGESAGMIVDVASSAAGLAEVGQEAQVCESGATGESASEHASGSVPAVELPADEVAVYYSLEFYNNRTGIENTLINVAAASDERAREIADERCPPEFRIVPPGARVGRGTKAVLPGEDSLRIRRQDGVEALVNDYSFKGMSRAPR